jgi:HSP20 family molecular chaperone IbpA
MSEVTIHRPEKAVGKSLFTEVAETLEAIKNRAFELFEKRGRAPGFELDDWFNAEQELFRVPNAEMKETDAEFTLEVDVAGFEDDAIRVSAVPGEIVVKADFERKGKTDFESKSLFRRFEMGTFDADKVAATVDKGILRIVAPKVVAKPVAVKPIASAEKKSGDSEATRAAAA